jgi:hypothetical protein
LTFSHAGGERSATIRVLVASFGWLPATGCSWILDFSDGAIPKNAPIDAPYSQAECDFKEGIPGSVNDDSFALTLAP